MQHYKRLLIITLNRLHELLIVVGDDDLTVKIWNADSMQCVQVIRTGCTVAALKLRCTHLGIGSFNALASLWNRSAGEQLGRYIGHTSAVFAVDFNVSWNIFVTGSADKTVMLWSMSSNIPLRSIKILFKPTFIHLIVASDTPLESQVNSFMLVTNDSVQCEAWFVRRSGTDNADQCKLWPLRFCKKNVVLSGRELPPQELGVVVTVGSQSVGVDVLENKKLILSCPVSTETKDRCQNCVALGSSMASVAFKEYQISFQGSNCKDSVNMCTMKSNSKSSLLQPESMLCASCRYVLSVGDDTKLMLLAAGSRFSVYMRPRRDNNELIIVRHYSSSSSWSECVGHCQLPNNCRSEIYGFFYISAYLHVLVNSHFISCVL